jgi:hypothetical protein
MSLCVTLALAEFPSILPECSNSLQCEILQRNRLAVSQEVKPGHPFLADPISERPSARFAGPVP